MTTLTSTDAARVVERALGESADALQALRSDAEARNAIARAAALIVEAFNGGKRVYSCGNGGSMCDAMHLAEELSGRFRGDRRGLAATAISDPGHISCVANDFGYEQVFARYLESHAGAGDVLVAISTSGTSRNVLAAAKVARTIGMQVVALTGRRDSPLGAAADCAIATPGGRYADRVQELHIKVIHILIELIERDLFPDNYAGER
ncbi:MAG TPA: SIS domain-containing protein [Casimicrobiaceae bacterium]|nr:SIS domain-containing protein [Casimicrobiaceae bacterium]